ncbi:MAG: acyl-CoA thioesterase [Gammaproteobacteria bacterium]|nr:acyl-CoA thioesterase [Gammaproteobacteria bacterium]MDH3859991.1 acyl-CoA thioesterase [Gammaproteobacteria bacterium]
MEFVSTVKVTTAQVDDLGHLNHVFALQILEYARDDWYAEAGLWQGRRWSGAENLATLVLNINFNYRGECFLDEDLKIITRPMERGSKSFTLAQQIVKPDSTIAIEGTVTSLVMDMEQHRTLPVPECLARYLPTRK